MWSLIASHNGVRMERAWPCIKNLGAQWAKHLSQSQPVRERWGGALYCNVQRDGLSDKSHSNKSHWVEVEGGEGVGRRALWPGDGKGGVDAVWCVNHPGRTAALTPWKPWGQRETTGEELGILRHEGKVMQTVHSPLYGMQSSRIGVWEQITPWLNSWGSIRCTASKRLEFNYVKNELRLKDGNKQGAFIYSSHTRKNLLR